MEMNIRRNLNLWTRRFLRAGVGNEREKKMSVWKAGESGGKWGTMNRRIPAHCEEKSEHLNTISERTLIIVTIDPRSAA